MQKFLEDTIESRFIKSLLYNTYLPTIKTVNNNDYIIEGFTYIYKKDIIKCTKTGYLWDMLYEDTAEFDIIDDYEFNTYYSKFSGRFISHNNYYDKDTHMALGHYLRCYRDIYNIDLMPFYNCYAGEYSSAFYLTVKDGIVPKSNLNYKTLMIPIKFNKTYTIAVDSPSQIIISSGFIYNKDLITVDDISITDILHTNISGCTISYTNSSFLSPITYTLDLSKIDSNVIKQQLETYENYLYLLVQVPYSNTSSSVVLEGDYTNVKSMKIANWGAIFNYDPEDCIPQMSSTEINSIVTKNLISNLSLLKFNDHISHPFSDRLIEYLLRNVIDSEEHITKNIQRVQNYLGYPPSNTSDIWSESLRTKLFYTYCDEFERPYDIIGFVDKDVEKMLLKKKAGE